MMQRKVWWLFYLPLLTACTTVDVPYRVLANGISTGWRPPTPSYTLVTNTQQYRHLFRELHGYRQPPPAIPAVDFNHSLVLLVTAGDKPSTGYRLDVTHIAQDGATLRVMIRLRSPAPTTFSAMMMTHPFVLVQVPKSPAVRRVTFASDDTTVLATLPMPSPRLPAAR